VAFGPAVTDGRVVAWSEGLRAHVVSQMGEPVVTVQPAPSRTQAFARILGPFLVVLAVSVLLRVNDTSALLQEFTARDVWPWVTGAYATAAGLAIVAFHRSWRGPAATLVSLIGWALLAKGVLLLAAPNSLDPIASRMASAPAVAPVVYALLILIGLYLTCIGWNPDRIMPRRSASENEAAEHHANVPHAAT
jgi:hypothetical protein